jgi:hypothetical protein
MPLVRLNNILDHLLSLTTYLNLLNHLLPNMGNIIPPWRLHFVLEMLPQSPRLAWSSATGWFMAPSTCSTLASSTSLVWLKIWRPISAIVCYWSSVFSKVAMGVVNTSKACGVFEIKTISWPIPIWHGVKSKLIDKNFEDSVLLSSTINERSTCSAYSIIDFSLLLVGSLIIVATWISIVKVWTRVWFLNLFHLLVG